MRKPEIGKPGFGRVGIRRTMRRETGSWMAMEMVNHEGVCEIEPDLWPRRGGVGEDGVLKRDEVKV